MEREEGLKNDLIGKFSFLEGKIDIPRARRIFVEVPGDNFLEVCEFAAKELGFDSICTITGLDMVKNLQFIYHLADKNGIVLNLKLTVPKAEPVIKSVTSIFNGAIFYEKELKDLLGAQVEGLQQGGRRYPLPDGWPEGQYPLRKDWNPVMMRQSREGVE